MLFNFQLHQKAFKTLIVFLIVNCIYLEFVRANGDRRHLSSAGNANTQIQGDSGGYQKELLTSFSDVSYSSQDSSSELKALASLGFLMAPQIQIGGEGGITLRTASGRSITSLQAFFFGTFNFENRINGSFFAKAGLGFINTSSSSASSSSSSKSKSGLFLGFGKRFFLWPHLSYSPEIRITQLDNSSVFEIKALNFSLLF